MFKELVRLWKDSGIMTKAVGSFGSMLEDCAYVFQRSWKVVSGELTVEGEKDEIHGRDRRVNQKERDIRRLLLEHLTMNPGQDASGCLALMSVVKDAERIGDYSKNIFDLALVNNGRIGTLRHQKDIATIQQRVESNLVTLKGAFVDSDDNRAREILATYQESKEQCNKILHALFTEDMPKQEALITVLLVRYLKRVNSHVSNVASAIIYPLDKIDFVRGGLLE
ncbi:MAG: hypothetical protein GF418_00660 [Chitinivibrionales bacterium]|nr:hypothetical protein [Chitinivibrionales bacterium]MBD3394111.1 hypothetical protein [Chitinivibrionales bacterium]